MDRGNETKPRNRRHEKRQRFSKSGRAKQRRAWMLWASIAVFVLLGGALGAWMLRPGAEAPELEAQTDIDSAVTAALDTPPAIDPGETAPESSVDDAMLESESDVVVAVAATLGHPAYPLAMSEDGDTVRFLASDLGDGEAKHYTYMYGSLPIEFFLLESRDGVVRAAFNACDVCYGARRGYQQSGDLMVCVNCGRRFASNRINVVQGGCNPAPLDRRIEGEYVVIDVEDIVRGYRFF